MLTCQIFPFCSHNPSSFLFLLLHYPSPPPPQRGNAAARAQAGDESKDSDEEASQASGKVRWRDHVNELGLPNDGYDYGRHLKTMGGGRFIAASGEVGHALPGDGIYELPEDPEHWEKAKKGEGGGEEGQGLLKPVVDAITLSADCMDEDMEEALFGSDVEEEEEEGGEGGLGGFEELNDDFILQAGREPDSEEEAEEGGEGGGGGFDFEAHMAMLIAKSEKSLGWAPARGWEDGELEKLQRLTPHKGLEGYDTDEDEEEDEDLEEEEAGARRKSAAAMRRHRLREARAGETSAGGAVASRKERARVEEDFEDLLAEYSEDEIGELEDPEEEGANTRGVVEVGGEGGGMGGAGGAYIEHILDDFLKAKIAETDEEEGREEEEEEEVEEEVEEEDEEEGKAPRSRGLFATKGAVVEEEGEEAAGKEEEEEEEEVLDTVAAGGAGGADDMEQFIVKHDYLGVSSCCISGWGLGGKDVQAERRTLSTTIQTHIFMIPHNL